MKSSEERYLYSFTLGTINKAQNLAFHYSGFQISKTEGGKLGFNFLPHKGKGFYYALKRVIPPHQSQPGGNPFEMGPRRCAVHVGGWLHHSESRN